MTETPDRCRLVLIAPQGSRPDALAEAVSGALSGGDVASLILPQYGLDEAAFQKLAEAVTPLAQQAGAAVIIAGDSRVAGRVGADGLHFEGKVNDLAELVKRHSGKLIVGTGGVKTRHEAMELGEAQPDYMFFGRFGFDSEPAVHPRNLDLAAWWSPMIEIPCIVQAGSDIASIESAAGTGAEFVALSAAVFGEGVDPSEAVRAANRLLDEHAPKVEA